jgi:glycosyltransferase involved in cell wall biosynthesis
MDGSRRVLHVMRMTGVSGSENHVAELVGALREHGWRSDVLIPSPHPPPRRDLSVRLAGVADQVNVVSMRTDASPSLVRRLARLLRSGRYDVAHAHLVHADWHLALAGVLAREVPLVTTKHNPDPFRAMLAFRTVERAALRRYSAVIAISDALRCFLAATLGVGAVTVRYGLRASAEPQHRSTQSIDRLVAVGRLEKQKGFDVAIAAMRRIADEAPHVRLTIAGAGSLRTELEAQVERLDLRGSVTLVGWHDDIDQLLRDSDAFVHTARWEGFGLVLLEAMRASLPIVATQVAAIPEVVEDGVTGILVPPDDPNAVADAVLSLVLDPRRARELGRAGSLRLRQRFSPGAMARGVAAVYDSVAGPR